jgi:hypothetical protein
LREMALLILPDPWIWRRSAAGACSSRQSVPCEVPAGAPLPGDGA